MVDRHGTAYIAGLGSASIPTQICSTWLDIDAEALSYATAPEFMRSNPPESRIQKTKQSDIYAFALTAWEVTYLYWRTSNIC